jgi:arylsulfatase A-like enzyme
MDASIGAVMAAVRAGADTLVVFLSDNGAWLNAGSGLSNARINAQSGIGPFDGGSNGLLFEGKGSTWEGGVRVPCIMWRPGSIPAATVSMAPLSALDFFPTVFALAGLPLPAGMALDGHDVSRVILGDDAVGPWFQDFMFFWRESQVYAVRHLQYKVHYVTRSGFNTSDLGTVQDPPLVFDVEQDPSEAKALDSAPSTCSPEVAGLLDATAAALAAHLAALSPLPPAQYGDQDWGLVPCCPRADFDPQAAVAYARAGEWGLALWDRCVCARE